MAITRKTSGIEPHRASKKYEEALAFAQKVKLRCDVNGDYGLYKSFGKIMCSYNNGLISGDEMLENGRRILANHSELLRDFNAMVRLMNPKDNTTAKRKKIDRESPERVNKSLKFAKEETCAESYRLVKRNSEEKRPITRVKEIIDPQHESCVPSNRFLKGNSEKKRSSFRDDSRYETCAPSDPETCTPSYRFLQQRIALDEGSDPLRRVLNDRCAIAIDEVGSGETERSELDEAMDKWEDEMFETDLVVQNVGSALKNARKLESVLAEEERKRNPIAITIDVRDYFTHSDRTCLRLMFQGEGERIIELIGSRPKGVLSYVIRCLEEKEKYCRGVRNKRRKLRDALRSSTSIDDS